MNTSTRVFALVATILGCHQAIQAESSPPPFSVHVLSSSYRSTHYESVADSRIAPTQTTVRRTETSYLITDPSTGLICWLSLGISAGRKVFYVSLADTNDWNSANFWAPFWDTHRQRRTSSPYRENMIHTYSDGISGGSTRGLSTFYAQGISSYTPIPNHETILMPQKLSGPILEWQTSAQPEGSYYRTANGTRTLTLSLSLTKQVAANPSLTPTEPAGHASLAKGTKSHAVYSVVRHLQRKGYRWVTVL